MGLLVAHTSSYWADRAGHPLVTVNKAIFGNIHTFMPSVDVIKRRQSARQALFWGKTTAKGRDACLPPGWQAKAPSSSSSSSWRRAHIGRRCISLHFYPHSHRDGLLGRRKSECDWLQHDAEQRRLVWYGIADQLPAPFLSKLNLRMNIIVTLAPRPYDRLIIRQLR